MRHMDSKNVPILGAPLSPPWLPARLPQGQNPQKETLKIGEEIKTKKFSKASLLR